MMGPQGINIAAPPTILKDNVFGDAIVIGKNSAIADYGPFTPNTTTSGWAEALAAGKTYIVVLPGSYSGGQINTAINANTFIYGLGYAYYTVTSSTDTAYPGVLFGNSATAYEVKIANLNITATSQVDATVTAVTCMLSLHNVSFQAGTANAAIAQIGGPFGVHWSSCVFGVDTSFVASTTMTYGTTVSASAIYVNGHDIIPTAYGYTVIGRPQIQAVNVQTGGAVSGVTAAGLYLQDANNCDFQVNGGVAYGFVFYNPFADNYVNHVIQMFPGDNATSGNILYFSSYGEGGATGDSTVEVRLGGATNAVASIVTVTGMTNIFAGNTDPSPAWWTVYQV